MKTNDEWITVAKMHLKEIGVTIFTDMQVSIVAQCLRNEAQQYTPTNKVEIASIKTKTKEEILIFCFGKECYESETADSEDSEFMDSTKEAMDLWSEQNCDIIHALFNNPCIELKPLEDLWRKENSPNKFVIPDRTMFYKWITNKALSSTQEKQPEREIKEISDAYIKEMASDFIINTGGLPNTIERFQYALIKFKDKISQPISKDDAEERANQIVDDYLAKFTERHKPLVLSYDDAIECISIGIQSLYFSTENRQQITEGKEVECIHKWKDYPKYTSRGYETGVSHECLKCGVKKLK